MEKAAFLIQKASKETHPDYNIKALATLDSIINVNNRSNTYKLALQKKETFYIKAYRLNYSNTHMQMKIPEHYFVIKTWND